MWNLKDSVFGLCTFQDGHGTGKKEFGYHHFFQEREERLALMGGGGHLQIKMCYFLHSKKKTTGKHCKHGISPKLSVVALNLYLCILQKICHSTYVINMLKIRKSKSVKGGGVDRQSTLRGSTINTGAINTVDPGGIND